MLMILRNGSPRWSPSGLQPKIFGIYFTCTQVQNSVGVVLTNTPSTPKSRIKDQEVSLFLLLLGVIALTSLFGSFSHKYSSSQLGEHEDMVHVSALDWLSICFTLHHVTVIYSCLKLTRIL